MTDFNKIIDKYYPAGSRLRDIYVRHCSSVADLALEIAKSKELPLDPDDIRAGAMLHDIGIFLTDADGIDCHGTLPYLAHGMAGADLLRKEEYPEWTARIAERHTGAGLTASDIDRLNHRFAEAGNGFRLPSERSYMPETQLEQLICYADKFYSKSGDMQMKPIDRVRASMGKFGEEALVRFNRLDALFSIAKCR